MALTAKQKSKLPLAMQKAILAKQGNKPAAKKAVAKKPAKSKAKK